MTREEALKQWLPIVVMGVREMPEVKEAVKMAITALEQQPSSSENPNKWIHCEKRLPDTLNYVLVTFYDAPEEYDVAYMRKTFNATYKANGAENEWVSAMGETTYADYEVNAWMPIPTYNGG